jgi:hypothetical protein
VNHDGQFVTSRILTKSNLKVAIEAIVNKPVEDSQILLMYLTKLKLTQL